MDYAYVGYTEDKRLIKGKIPAASEQAAMDMLDNVGYRIISLKPITRVLPDFSKLLESKVKPQELITFSRQLALLLESGVGIVQALELLGAQTNDKQLKKVLIEAVADIRNGSSLSVALSKHPKVFPAVYHKMIGVGEQTGGLEGTLRNLADYSQRQSTTMSKLKTALTYPAIVLGLAVIVIAIMIVVVLPPIVDMFAALGGELPVTTKLLIASVDFLGNYGMYLFLAIAALGLVGFMYTRSPNGRYYLDMLILRLPVIGRLTLVAELARCCRSMSLLFRSGLPLPEIMTLTAQASGNRVVAKALGDVEHDMLRGEGIAGPMKRKWVFLPLMVEMTKVGEETGSLDSTLVTVADNYEIEAEARTQTLLSMIEPTMTIAMGAGVGFIAMSIFMPLYSSLSLVGG